MAALSAVLPPAADVEAKPGADGVLVRVAGQELSLAWIGEGRLGDARRFLEQESIEVDIVAARRLSVGAREALSQAGVGFVDETGTAEIAAGSILVSRTGHSVTNVGRRPRWTSSVIAVAEALLCGVTPTVSATSQATGLSTGASTNALRTLTEFGLLHADEARGPRSGRRIADPDRLLAAYATATEEAKPPPSIQVGVGWRDPVSDLVEVSAAWDRAGTGWAATGAVAAATMAPLLTSVTTAEVYIDADTAFGLDAAAAAIDLRPIDGGRLTLTSFPTVAVDRMASVVDGLRVAPWPRVYVDLTRAGVRGEEAAEHLRETFSER